MNLIVISIEISVPITNLAIINFLIFNLILIAILILIRLAVIFRLFI